MRAFQPRFLSVLGWVLLPWTLASGAPEPWNFKALSIPPLTEPAGEPSAEGVRGVFFEGEPWNGRPTRVFAWIGLPAERKGRVPGMVLVHGGGGTAFASWVRLWTSRGYAAIAMDTCGAIPVGTYGKWERHGLGGPPGWGGFDQIDQPVEAQWTYHAVAAVIRSHSLLRSLPEVDPGRIGITGISWGGYLTCIAAGVDRRFRFAAPVYGCGFLGENSAWTGTLQSMGPEKSRRWLALWDPSVYLPRARMPFLWVTGTTDFAYPMDSLQKSYRLPAGPRTLAVRVNMPHGHGAAGEQPEEIHAFANHWLRSGPAPAVFRRGGQTGSSAWAEFKGGEPAGKAELNFTRSTGDWTRRIWETRPAAWDHRKQRASAELPEATTVYYFNRVDGAGRVTSSEHVATGNDSSPRRDDAAPR